AGFDAIIGNPPYVCARNLADEVKQNLSNWSVCKTGNPDLYIPFFQIGFECLSENGILGFITMNTFFKSLNGRALRDYFKQKNIKLSIIDFGTYQIFKSKSTYTCICFVENKEQQYINYYQSNQKKLPKGNNHFHKVYYALLDSKKGWNLKDNKIISKIESTGIAFGELYKTRHGIATLKNDIYIFNPVNEDNDFYYLQNGSLYQIEKGICRDIINSNKLSREVDFDRVKEKIIFPYTNEDKPKLLTETYMKQNFPNAYKYLSDKRTILAKRDKGKGKYENWFAFGRTQSLERVHNKLFFPKMSDKIPSYIINSDEDLLFYNGQAIIGHNQEEMIIAKKIMESRLFWYYIKTTSKPYSSDYYSLNGNYIRNFGICNLSDDEKRYVMNEQNKKVLDVFFEKKYDIDLLEANV
ncbi:MAG: Eco57I restriction-modification methylase domain-containing protein, partial [Bacteroidales bacterium]